MKFFKKKTDKSLTHIHLLGLKAKDRVTGFEGIVTSVNFDLYGCIQVILTPLVDKTNKSADGKWYDVARLLVYEESPILQVPDFLKGYIAEGLKGSAEKPAP